MVQLYVCDLESRLARPEQELCAFEKVELDPGERQTLRFSLPPRALSYWDPAAGESGKSGTRGAWVAEPGEFELRASASSRDVRARAEFRLRGE